MTQAHLRIFVLENTVHSWPLLFFNNHMNLRACRRNKEIQAITLEKWNVKRERHKGLESYLNTTFSEA
jgi:hypothetical protein